MKQFIQILNHRIRLSTIKRYKEKGDDTIMIYYNTSPSRPDWEMYHFPDEESRDAKLKEIDDLLL